MSRQRLKATLRHALQRLMQARIVQVLTNLFVDESGNHLTDENGDRLGEF